MKTNVCRFALLAGALAGAGAAQSDVVYSDYYYRGGSNQWDGAYFSKTKDGPLVAVDWGSTNRIILTEGQTVYLDNAAIDALDNLLALKLSGKNITIYMDVAEDNDLKPGVCPFTSGTYGNTWLVKTGAGKLTFKSTSCYKGSQDSYDYYVDLDIRGGAVQFQPKYTGRHNLCNLKIAEGATFYCTSGNTTTTALSLSGAGTVNGTTGSEEFRISGTRATATEFSGKVTGIARLSPAGHTYFTGTASDVVNFRPFNYVGTADRGIAGFKTFAGASGTASSFGKAGTVDLLWGPACLLYLGTTGETVARTVEFGDASMASDHLAPFVLDAGASGGLTWTGVFKNSVGLQQRVTLTGAKTGAPSTLANKFTNSSTTSGKTASFYLLKKGKGVWRKTQVDGDAFQGAADVEEGTLGFNTIRDVGFVSALGTAKAVYVGSRGSPDSLARRADVHRLGGSGETAVFSYEGTRPRTVTTRPIGLVGNAQIAATNTAAFRWQGISSASAGEKTLSVLSKADATVTLADVSDGAGRVSVALDSPGTLVLTGNNDFTGDLAANVSGGTVTVRNVNGAAYSWYKLTIREIVCKNTTCPEYQTNSVWHSYSYMELDEWALYDSKGDRQNNWGKDVVSLTTESYELLEPGHISCPNNDLMNYYFGKGDNYNKNCVGNLLNNDHSGGYVWNAYMNDHVGCTLGDSNSWLSAVLRMKAGAKTVTGMDLRIVGHVTAGRNFGCLPTAYTVYGSSDGMIWEEVASTNDMVNLPTKYYMWVAAQKYESRAASDPVIPLARTAMKSDYTVAKVRSVYAAPGASVVSEGGTVETEGLRLNAAGGCTIDGFTLAAEGTFEVEGAASTHGSLTIPNVCLENMTGLDNLKDWSVTVNGTVRHRSLAYDSASRTIKVGAPGFVLFFR